jgi:hypothetical protein
MESNEKDYPVNDLISLVTDHEGRLYLVVSEELPDDYCGGYKYIDHRVRLDDKDALRLIDVVQTLLKRPGMASTLVDETSITLSEEEIF